MMTAINNPAYRRAVEIATRGFTVFKPRRPQIGEQRVFIYPNFGTPDGHPDYTRHRFHVVEVIAPRDPDDYDYANSHERMFTVRAADGWEGAAWASELFPLPKGATT